MVKFLNHYGAKKDYRTGEIYEKYPHKPHNMSKACQIECHGACKGFGHQFKKCCCFCHNSKEEVNQGDYLF